MWCILVGQTNTRGHDKESTTMEQDSTNFTGGFPDYSGSVDSHTKR